MKDFYSIFRLGVEVEGEFINCPESDDRIAEIKEDGSLDDRHGGYLREVVSPIITDEGKEVAFIDYFRDLTVNDALSIPAFAYQNNTAGTHIHVSFQDKPDEMLLVFDTKRFARFFFKKYKKEFGKSVKFMQRLSNNYCNRLERLATVADEYYHREKASGSERYNWLNTTGILSGQNKGIEFRIFPHLQTAEGLDEVIQFIKKVVGDYYHQSTTQKELKMLELVPFARDGGTLTVTPFTTDAIRRLPLTTKIILLSVTGENHVLTDRSVVGQACIIIGALLKKYQSLTSKTI